MATEESAAPRIRTSGSGMAAVSEGFDRRSIVRALILTIAGLGAVMLRRRRTV
jgi:hypothetical protein